MANLLARKVMAQLAEEKTLTKKEKSYYDKKRSKQGNLTLEEQALLVKVIKKEEEPSFKESSRIQGVESFSVTKKDLASFAKDMAKPSSSRSVRYSDKGKTRETKKVSFSSFGNPGMD